MQPTPSTSTTSTPTSMKVSDSFDDVKPDPSGSSQQGSIRPDIESIPMMMVTLICRVIQSVRTSTLISTTHKLTPQLISEVCHTSLSFTTIVPDCHSSSEWTNALKTVISTQKCVLVQQCSLIGSAQLIVHKQTTLPIIHFKKLAPHLPIDPNISL